MRTLGKIADPCAGNLPISSFLLGMVANCSIEPCEYHLSSRMDDPSGPTFWPRRPPAQWRALNGTSGSGHHAHPERNHEQDDEHPEQHSRSIHREAGDTAEADSGRNQGDHQEYKRVVKKVTHL